MTDNPLPHARPQVALASEAFVKISHHLSRAFSHRTGSEHQLTLSEWRVLVHVQRSPGISAQLVAQRTGFSSMNVSRALTSLRRDNRVRVERDPQDSRRNLLWSTDAGDALVAQLLPDAAEHAAAVYSVLTPDELVFLNGMLARVAANAELLEEGLPEADTDTHEGG